MTARTDASARILAALGTEKLTINDIVAKTGIADLGVRSALRSMRLRGAVRRTYVDRMQLFSANPGSAKGGQA
jgi:DNA-binding transcriptional regulator GbsR (MarR family)